MAQAICCWSRPPVHRCRSLAIGSAYSRPDAAPCEHREPRGDPPSVNLTEVSDADALEPALTPAFERPPIGGWPLESCCGLFVPQDAREALANVGGSLRADVSGDGVDQDAASPACSRATARRHASAPPLADRAAAAPAALHRRGLAAIKPASGPCARVDDYRRTRVRGAPSRSPSPLPDGLDRLAASRRFAATGSCLPRRTFSRRLVCRDAQPSGSAARHAAASCATPRLSSAWVLASVASRSLTVRTAAFLRLSYVPLAARCGLSIAADGVRLGPGHERRQGQPRTSAADRGDPPAPRVVSGRVTSHGDGSCCANSASHGDSQPAPASWLNLPRADHVLPVLLSASACRCVLFFNAIWARRFSSP